MNATNHAIDGNRIRRALRRFAPSVGERRVRRRAGRAAQSIRAHIAALFARIGHGVSDAAAFERTKDFYRRSGADWTRDLT